jgi:hypothetical protein
MRKATIVIPRLWLPHRFTYVLIGMEPAGHYWRKITFFAKAKGYEVRYVGRTVAKHQRELDESASAKSDIKNLLQEIPLVQYILSLPGTGLLSCGIFLIKVGEPRALQKPAADHHVRRP